MSNVEHCLGVKGVVGRGRDCVSLFLVSIGLVLLFGWVCVCLLHKKDFPSICLSSKAMKSMHMLIIYYYKFNTW